VDVESRGFLGWESDEMRTLLVVDDHREVRGLLERTLARKDYKMLGAGSGQEALTLARHEKPDLIIMDIGMPGPVNGIQATQILKSHPETRHTKVIVLTGRGDARAPEDAAKAGADAFISKPFSPLDLLRKIEELLG
jgi:CheY-like chemotaxis protein